MSGGRTAGHPRETAERLQGGYWKSLYSSAPLPHLHHAIFVPDAEGVAVRKVSNLHRCLYWLAA